MDKNFQSKNVHQAINIWQTEQLSDLINKIELEKNWDLKDLHLKNTFSYNKMPKKNCPNCYHWSKNDKKVKKELKRLQKAKPKSDRYLRMK